LGNAADYLKRVFTIKEFNLLNYLLIDGVKYVDDAANKESIDHQCNVFADSLITKD